MSAGSSKQEPQARVQRTPWNWIEALCIGLLAILGADLVLGLLVSMIGSVLKAIPALSGLGSAFNSQSVTANFIFYTGARLLGFGLIMAFVRSRKVSLRQFGFKGFKIGRALGLVLASSALLLVATIIVFLILKRVIPSVNLDQQQEIVFTTARSTPEIVLAFFALVIIAPIVEESIFRGFMLPVFAARFGIVFAAIITSVLFGLVHWQLNVSIVTGLMGLLLAWLYYKTRSLWPAIMFHSLKNLVAFILLIHR